MRIFIDADACPVKAETLKVAARYSLPVTLISNGGIRPSRDPMVSTMTVPAGADAADDKIVELAQKGDIAITADIPLAARLLEKYAVPISPKGKVFTQSDIGMALAVRQLNQDIREANQSQTFNAPFSARDRSSFLQALDKIIVQARNNKSG